MTLEIISLVVSFVAIVLGVFSVVTAIMGK